MTATASRRVAIPVGEIAPRPAPQGGRVRTLSGLTMGTTWSVKFVGSDAGEQMLGRLIPRALDRVVTQMSPWEPDSDLSRFNRLPPDGWQTLPSEFARVIGCAIRIARESDGAYDPTMGALADLWGFGPGGPRQAPPPADAVTMHVAACGWRQLDFDATARRLRRHDAGPLDLCGIAKGFAVDLVMETLREHGIHHALVEIGGELSGRGVKPDGSPWWVDVDGASATSSAPPMLVALHDLAIATSGVERGFSCNDAHFSHTLDPRSGRPIANGMVTATVLHRSCMEADAYATALMVKGPDAAIEFAAAHGLAALIRFRRDRDDAITERTTPALDAMLA